MNCAWLLCLVSVSAAEPANRWSTVDEQGVLRWRDDGSEIALFGVNYYAPFTIDHQGIAALGEDHRRTIERDVAHFARLGLDVIRLHVFDRQVSDLEGNLVASEHLDLFDYLVHCCQQRGIYTVLTPIAWWPYHVGAIGFASRFTMPEMTSLPEARHAQQRYLRQFLEHVNPYTGRAYKDEPAIVAIELINEPLYPPGTTTDQVRQYIDDLAAAVRSTGAPQPIFYNGWQGEEEAVAASSVEGCSFGWYPTGLVSGGSLRGDYLATVDDYPQMRIACLHNKAKIVYEFDAADVPGRVMYPAMARAFRSGGAQIACQFQYDPLPLAAFNYGWHTHYLNLVHTPGKAISFAIAAEVFRQVPRHAQFATYPDNTAFASFHVNFERDLSEMVTDKVFLHANHTSRVPPAPEQLQRVAGCGRSPLVQYEGTGAYFLDRLAAGVWRLEVYPDAVTVSEPFAPTSLQREVSRLIWTQHPLTVRLPDLGNAFTVRSLTSTELPRRIVDDGTWTVEPGAYLLVREGVEPPSEVSSDFFAPQNEYADVAIWLRVAREWRQGCDVSVHATVASPEVADVRFHWGTSSCTRLEPYGSYEYHGTIPGDNLEPGMVFGRLAVHTRHGTQWIPHAPGHPSAIETNNVAGQPTSDVPVTSGQDAPPLSAPSPGLPIEVLAADAPIPIFRLDHRSVPVQGQANRVQAIVPGPRPGHNALRVETTGFGVPPNALHFRKVVPDGVENFRSALADGQTVRITARATSPHTDRLELVLIERDSAPWGTEIELSQQWTEIVVPLAQLRFFHHWNHPRHRGGPGDRFAPENVESVNICFGAWLYGDAAAEPHGIEIDQVSISP